MERWVAQGLKAGPFADHLADLVDAIGRAALPALERLAAADGDAALRRTVTALRPVAAAL